MKTKLMAMVLAAGAMLGAYATNVRVYVNAPSSVAWGDCWFCYAWDSDPLLGKWPGTQAVKTETLDGVTWHYLDVTVNSDFCLILNDGSGKQTGDIAVTGVSDGKAYFIEVAKSGACQIVNVGVVASTHNKVQLWENGPYWAETNIGADEPWDSGYHFWWGDTVGYYRENNAWVASDGSSLNFSFVGANAPTYGKDVATLQSEGWITADGVLHPTNDAAHVHWGGRWRMPTKQELDDLNNKCDWTWTTQNGVNGYVVRGRGDYASNSIFLPCAGFGYGTSLYSAGSNGYYWSSVPRSDGSGYAYELDFDSGSHYTNSYYRVHGQSVRPVQDAPAPVTVTFDENFKGGSTTNMSVLSTSKVLANVPAVPARVGWELVGWFDAAEGGNQILADALPTDGATYYAHWVKAEMVTIGEGTGIKDYLPAYSLYNYSLTQQIYTPNEIGGSCTLHRIAFKNGGTERTRTIDVYLVHTSKSSFTGNTDWISATTADKVFSGSVTFTTGEWTAIPFDVPFDYNGTDNLAVIVDDNTGTWASGLKCYVYDAPNKALYVSSDGTNYDPTNPAGYSGTVLGVKNQIQLLASGLATVSVTFDENFEGGAKTETNFLASATILANAPDVSARDGWTFAGWFDATEGGNQISATDLPTDGATYYAHWTPGPDQIAAGAAAALIAAIGDVAYTDESKAKIDAARAAYDALTPAQQALVGNYATLAAAEEAYAALVPAPWGCYQVLSESDITAPYAAPKAATLAGAVYDGCDVVGIVNLRLGKVNAKKKTGKVSGSVTLLDGKKRTIKSVSVTGIDGVSPKSVALSVKGLGTMNVTIGGTRFAGSLGGYHVQSAAVGGKWTRADAKVYVAFGGAALPAGTIEDLLPDGEPVIPRGGKWAFGKASSVKYAKDAKTKVLTLTVNDRNGTARNRSAMKLSYNPKTGVFKGSFKVYAIQGGKLKKITAKVNGVVADGDGHGRATIQKSGVFPVTVE